MKSSIAILCALVLFLAVKRTDMIDTGQSLFFPKDTYEKIHDFSLFQLGQWNNVIVPNEKDALGLCQELRQNKLVLKVLCEPALTDFSPLVKSYLGDQFFNYKAPTKIEFENLSNGELAKLSVLMGPQGQELLEFMRLDPVNHKEALLDKVKTKLNANFEWKEGLLRHKGSPAILIPVQFSYKPEQIEKSAEIEVILSKYNAVMIGVHQGHLSNQGTIISDLNNVGIVGTIVTIFALIFIWYFKLFKLAKLILPNALGVCVSIIITWLVFGKVHAITITFGTGIIGLAVDFGLHAIFLEDKKQVWHSNLYGFLTTLAVFIIFIFSEIPLIKQMMFFSTVALMGSYLFTYLLVGNDYIPVSHDIIIKKSRWHLIPLIISLVGLFHLTTFKMDTSVKRFNYTSQKVEETQTWFYSQMKNEKIFFKIYPKSKWGDIETDFKKGEEIGVRSESIYSLIPTANIQKENLDSWIQLRDSKFKTTSDKEKIFAPFFEKLNALRPNDRITLEHPPEYLKHMVQEDKALNLWFVKGGELEEKKIKENIPGAESLVEIFLNFTKRMTDEVIHFIPITFLLIFVLLFIKYRSVVKSLICLIPFLFALGLYGLLYRYFNFPMSFMTLLGLFLIYGLSVDYGIFTTDLFTESNQSVKTESSFNFGLILTWITNFLGFAPLLFCNHPILKDLGLVLVVGMIGVFYGTFFVLPAVFIKAGKA
ncbi:hypothetical protein SHI21_13205 [Bacteriovorax sp. PP10]|uniref:Exporter n=1 Tax=Bacteriovorax antarcticus TaxID=3088717 RepID=A0ABU5VVU1_9BACT|nr:hypothetical protein [Bacteriovorax sp. PP10]MEA9357176.1 hypothetical protein [Bacteriovorax sp. PP10]